MECYSFTLSSTHAGDSGLGLGYVSGSLDSVLPTHQPCIIVALRQAVTLELCGEFGEIEQQIEVPAFASFCLHAPQGFALPTMRVRCRGPFLLIRASVVTWRVLSDLLQQAKSQAGFYPGSAPVHRALARFLLRHVNAARRAPRYLLELRDLKEFAALSALQNAHYSEMLDRCPGRSIGQRMQVLRRLFSIQQVILLSNQRTAVSDLAILAHFSRAYFMSTYHEVFQTTAHAQMLERRLQRAHKLLCEQHLSVAEVTLAAGFEDRSNFSRSYQRRFGMPPSRAKIASKRAA